MEARHWIVAGSVAAIACGPSGGDAPRDASGRAVPEALALALITNAAEESHIFVGAPPATLGAVLPGIDRLAVVGGLTRDDGGTVVFDVAGSAEAAMDVYAAEIEREGWERAPDDRGLRGGFMPGPQPIGGTWCSEKHWLRASSVSFDGSEYLRVRYYEVDTEPTPCSAAQMRAQMSLSSFGLRLPVLSPPAGATVKMGGGGGSTDASNQDALVVTDLSADELFDHYARQVSREGWERGNLTSGDGLAIGRWSARTDTGEPAQGVLAIWPLPEAGTYRAWVRLERVPGNR